MEDDMGKSNNVLVFHQDNVDHATESLPPQEELNDLGEFFGLKKSLFERLFTHSTIDKKFIRGYIYYII
jgi:hypothetical protein